MKDLVDEIIAEEFSSPDLELHWLDEDADAAATETALEGRVKLGALTLNEMREHLGLDPYANAAARRSAGFFHVKNHASIEGRGGSRLGPSACVRCGSAARVRGAWLPLVPIQSKGNAK